MCQTPLWVLENHQWRKQGADRQIDCERASQAHLTLWGQLSRQRVLGRGQGWKSEAGGVVKEDYLGEGMNDEKEPDRCRRGEKHFRQD